MPGRDVRWEELRQVLCMTCRLATAMRTSTGKPAKPLIVSHGLSNGTTVRDIRRLVREGKSMRREREDSLQQSTIIICDNAQSQVVMALFFMIDIS